jgi:hypothetical protein
VGDENGSAGVAQVVARAEAQPFGRRYTSSTKEPSGRIRPVRITDDRNSPRRFASLTLTAIV